MRRSLIILILMFTLAACNVNPTTTISFETLPEIGNAANGEALFTAQGCIACHVEGATGAPNLTGFSERSGTSVEGQSTREYAFYSIAEPAQHIAEGFGNAMPNNYDENMTSQEIADLVAYLLGL